MAIAMASLSLYWLSFSFFFFSFLRAPPYPYHPITNWNFDCTCWSQLATSTLVDVTGIFATNDCAWGFLFFGLLLDGDLCSGKLSRGCSFFSLPCNFPWYGSSIYLYVHLTPCCNYTPTSVNRIDLLVSISAFCALSQRSWGKGILNYPSSVFPPIHPSDSNSLKTYLLT